MAFGLLCLSPVLPPPPAVESPAAAAAPAAKAPPTVRTSPAVRTPALKAPALKTPALKTLAAAAAGSTARPRPRPQGTRRLIGLLLILAGCCILPWIAALALDPPLLVEPSKWNDAWIGIDACEAVGLLATGLLLRRGDVRMRMAAAATAVLLFADACFDLSTATPSERPLSILMAGLAEVPIGLLCAFLAFRRRLAQPLGDPP